MVNVISVKMNLLKGFGEISEKRIKAIHDYVKDEYPSANSVPLGTLLFHPEERRHILLTPNQISFGQDGVELAPEFSRLKELTEKIFDVLMIDNSANVLYDYIGLLPGTSPTLQDSLKFLDSRKQALLDNITGIDGLGLRFYYTLNGNRGDFRIEPYIQDMSKYFLQLQLSPNNISTPLDEMFINAEQVFKEFTGNLSEFASSIIR